MNAPVTAPISAFRHPGRPRYDDADRHVRHLFGKNLIASDFYDAVRAIAEGEIIGTHHHAAFDRAECGVVADRFLRSGEITPYDGADLDHFGMSFFEAGFGGGRREAYFGKAIPNIQRARAMWGSARFPLDLVRSLLDEASPAGANLFRIGNRPCAAGLIRVQNDGVEIMPHDDHAGRDMCDSLEAQQIEVQITVVIPLSVGSGGGEPTIYPVRLSKNQYDANRLPEPHAYAVGDQVLPPFGVTLKPEVGDLMMWDARYLHRVSKVVGTPRVSLSFFIGICRDGRIVVFS